MGNAHVIGCVLPLGAFNKAQICFQSFGRYCALPADRLIHCGCNIVRFLAAVCTEEAEPARSNSSAIANNAGDSQKARCLRSEERRVGKEWRSGEAREE